MTHPATAIEATQLAHLRRDYTLAAFSESEALDDPFAQFAKWMAEARAAEIPEPNAMTLATAFAGRPQARTVLLKDVNDRGFSFFTNYESRKGLALAHNAAVALCFPWIVLERQVIIEGVVEKVSREESEAYFAVRPRMSQLGAWASSQSREVASRNALEAAFVEVEARFDGQPVPTPEWWGGYRVLPTQFEFWQGRRSRMHDRILYLPDNGAYRKVRLSP